MPADRYLSTPRASQVLGVSASTVKRWVDQGILPAHKTPGGHRRILATDLLRLVRGGRLPFVDLEPVSGTEAKRELPGSELLTERLVVALERGDAEAARSVVAATHELGMPVDRLADEVIAPAMARIGHGWETGRLDVYQEHRGTQTCLAALHDLRARIGPLPAGSPVAVGGSPESDHYLLATLLAELVLRENGWAAVNIGPNTPAASFRLALAQLKPRLLWISFSHLPDPVGFLTGYRPLYEDARVAGVAVVVGGRALTERVRARMPYTAFGDSMAHLAAFAQTLHPIGRPPRRGRPKR